MKNTEAISVLLDAAEHCRDPLDELACERAAFWLRWCDGFGATVTGSEASILRTTNSLGEVSRGIILRLSMVFPAPPEDIACNYLKDDHADWQGRFRFLESKPARTVVDDPFDRRP